MGLVPAILRPHLVTIERQTPAGLSLSGELRSSIEVVMRDLPCLLDPVSKGQFMTIEGRIFVESQKMFIDGVSGTFTQGDTFDRNGFPHVAAFARYAYPDIRQGDRVRAGNGRSYSVTNIRVNYALYPVMEADLGMEAFIDEKEPRAW